MPPQENKVLGAIRKGINAKYSVPAWLWVILSATVGFLLTFIAFLAPGTAMTFLAALPLTGKLLGPVVLGFSGLAMYGMSVNHPRYVKWASFVCFLAWVFLGIAFFIDGGLITFLIMPLWMIVFWAYKYLAAWVRELDGI